MAEQTQGARAIALHTLAQLRDREQQLLRFESDLDETRKLIKVLEKSVGEPQRSTPKQREETGNLARQILEVLRTAGSPLSTQQINQAIEKPEGYTYTSTVLGNLLKLGRVDKRGGEYTLGSTGVTA